MKKETIAKKAKVVAIYHRKGGVGKTTASLCLAFGLARMGKKVLLIDSDSSANTSESACSIELTETTPTIKDVFLGLPIEKVIYKSVEENVDIIPSCFAVSVVERMLVSELSRETILREALEPIRSMYDVIIIDTQPGVETIPTNAICAANEVIIPIFGTFAKDIMEQIFNMFTQIKKRKLNPELIIRGILITKFEAGTNASKNLQKDLIENYGPAVFNTVIPKCNKLEECTQHKQSIYEYAPDSTGAIGYMAFTEELIKRWGWN